MAAAVTGGVLTMAGRPARAEPPPETQRLRLIKEFSICLAPLYVAEELLAAEGFTRVEYVPLEGSLGTAQMLGKGKGDIGMDAAPVLLMALDGGERLTILGGVHVGCYELFVTGQVRTIRDLRGKTVAVSQLRDDRHAFVASFLTHVGLDPRKDVRWAVHDASEAMGLLAAGKIDGFLGFPPEPQELRARKIGHVLVKIGTDRPWAQYFCCMAVANREFVRKHPVATRRRLRAILKANALCAQEPERVTRLLVDKGYTTQRDYAQQTLKEIPYAAWREYNAADTLRFYALRLQEAGMVKSAPQKIMSEGADWRWLDELKNELKR